MRRKASIVVFACATVLFGRAIPLLQSTAAASPNDAILHAALLSAVLGSATSCVFPLNTRISGLIGFPVLDLFRLQIDYHNGLVKLTTSTLKKARMT